MNDTLFTRVSALGVSEYADRLQAIIEADFPAAERKDQGIRSFTDLNNHCDASDYIQACDATYGKPADSTMTIDYFNFLNDAMDAVEARWARTETIVADEDTRVLLTDGETEADMEIGGHGNVWVGALGVEIEINVVNGRTVIEAWPKGQMLNAAPSRIII